MEKKLNQFHFLQESKLETLLSELPLLDKKLLLTTTTLSEKSLLNMIKKQKTKLMIMLEKTPKLLLMLIKLKSLPNKRKSPETIPQTSNGLPVTHLHFQSRTQFSKLQSFMLKNLKFLNL